MSKFTKELGEKLCRLHRNGLPLKACAKKCRISRGTVYNWLKAGEKAKSGLKREFYLNWHEADADYQKYHIDKIYNSKDWRASKYLLEVNSPEDYVVREQFDVNTNAEVEVKNENVKSIFDKVDEALDNLK